MRSLLVLLPVLLLLLALAAAPARAEEARVVASPGCPEGLHPFLPGGRPPGLLTWPLPDGPLIVLALPREDDLAADLMRLWQIAPPSGDLHGGYVTCAWHDGGRSIHAIFAEDASALWMARAEFEKDAAGPRRWRHVRPMYRIRAGATWLWVDTERDVWERVLLPLLPRNVSDPKRFLLTSAVRLSAASKEKGTSTWMAPLAAWLERRAADLPANAVGVPRVPTGARADGVLDEVAWRYAAVREHPSGVQVNLFADGRHLYVAVRAPEALGRLTLLFDRKTCMSLDTDQGTRTNGRVTFERLHHATWMQADAYPTRVLHLAVKRGEEVLLDLPLVLMP